MTPLEKLLRAEARRLGIGVEVLLKDYAIGHVLGAIAAEPTLSDTLVFKGGTALKKLYFGDYRFFNGYGEPVPGILPVYRLDEIVAEKLRAVLQCVAANTRRRWTRSRPRDYYDLWRILTDHGAVIDSAGFPDLLGRKCTVRAVTFQSPADFFPVALIDVTRETWVRSLGPLVPDLPPFDTVLDELVPRVAALLTRRAGWRLAGRSTTK